METRVDRILRWAKNNRVISVVIVMGIFIVIIGTMTDNMKKISDFADRYRDKNRSTTTLPVPDLEYRREKISMTPIEVIKPEQSEPLPSLKAGASGLLHNLANDRQNTEGGVKALIASLKNITDDYYAMTNLISGVRLIKGGITGSQLADIISSAQIEDDYYYSQAIISCSKCLIQPVTDKDIESILSSIEDDYYRKNAAAALFSAINR